MKKNLLEEHSIKDLTKMFDKFLVTDKKEKDIRKKVAIFALILALMGVVVFAVVKYLKSDDELDYYDDLDYDNDDEDFDDDFDVEEDIYAGDEDFEE